MSAMAEDEGTGGGVHHRVDEEAVEADAPAGAARLGESSGVALAVSPPAQAIVTDSTIVQGIHE